MVKMSRILLSFFRKLTQVFVKEGKGERRKKQNKKSFFSTGDLHRCNTRKKKKRGRKPREGGSGRDRSLGGGWNEGTGAELKNFVEEDDREREVEHHHPFAEIERLCTKNDCQEGHVQDEEVQREGHRDGGE